MLWVTSGLLLSAGVSVWAGSVLSSSETVPTWEFTNLKSTKHNNRLQGGTMRDALLDKLETVIKGIRVLGEKAHTEKIRLDWAKNDIRSNASVIQSNANNIQGNKDSIGGVKVKLSAIENTTESHTRSLSSISSDILSMKQKISDLESFANGFSYLYKETIQHSSVNDSDGGDTTKNLWKKRFCALNQVELFGADKSWTTTFDDLKKVGCTVYRWDDNNWYLMAWSSVPKKNSGAVQVKCQATCFY